MIKVVFVGDEPSRTNVSANIAFVGAKCFSTVTKWIKQLDPDYYICLNSNNLDHLADISALNQSGFKIVALGVKASKRLEQSKIPHTILPHPSGLNRKLNDKEQLELDLSNTYKYIRSNT